MTILDVGDGDGLSKGVGAGVQTNDDVTLHIRVTLIQNKSSITAKPHTSWQPLGGRHTLWVMGSHGFREVDLGEESGFGGGPYPWVMGLGYVTQRIRRESDCTKKTEKTPKAVLGKTRPCLWETLTVSERWTDVSGRLTFQRRHVFMSLVPLRLSKDTKDAKRRTCCFPDVRGMGY